jgi:hypothetical protein
MHLPKFVSVFSAGLVCGLILHWTPFPSTTALGRGDDQGRSGSALTVGCSADIAPAPNGDGVVNVSDLLAVINAWGQCTILDADGDGVPDNIDNCPTVANADQADADQDGVGDACDNCPNATNPDQADSNQNGIGDVCEDLDGDGWTVLQGDCDDANPSVHPGAIEVCNGMDDDCDGLIDNNATGCLVWYRDLDHDTYGNCSDFICACQPNPALGYTANVCGDCNDSLASVHPGAIEICGNGIDDDCDGLVDENCQ